MKLARSTMVTAAAGAAAALAVTGITYASAASGPAPQAAPAAAVPAAADPATAPAATPSAGSGQGKGNNNNEWQGKGNEGRREEGRGREEEGRIEINERSYSAHPGDCITVVSDLGAKTLNVHNESRKRVEVFRGAVCDNGAPIATVGPHSSSFGVDDLHTKGIHVKNGVVASFRVDCDRDDRDEHGDRGDRGDRDDD
ncbi:hypothetical protein [Streptomyces roseochromogenus]|uniref:Uncharacterized protein n=1 Tax=Streptomyces roseochromogenus subsp. oscitans DS 12.976 TaxID=1352936 RepID=V6JIB6_STRRC|nr:hypothetical protein [Streptomyces roseochromogenus]EST18881.1 hypothetical protein M878_43995 [Streptomyces roseochromogenus subsp. oscitans DS 12.976]